MKRNETKDGPATSKAHPAAPEGQGEALPEPGAPEPKVRG